MKATKESTLNEATPMHGSSHNLRSWLPALHAADSNTSSANARDELSGKLAQLRAMLTVVSGSGFESFNEFNDELRGNYLWACATLATECEQLADSIR